MLHGIPTARESRGPTQVAPWGSATTPALASSPHTRLESVIALGIGARDLGLTDDDIAVATGIRGETARRRLRALSGSAATAQRLPDLHAVIELLRNSKLLYPDEIGRFLKSRNRDLGYARPLVLLGRGHVGRVCDAAELLLSRLDGLGSERDGQRLAAAMNATTLRLADVSHRAPQRVRWMPIAATYAGHRIA